MRKGYVNNKDAPHVLRNYGLSEPRYKFKCDVGHTYVGIFKDEGSYNLHRKVAHKGTGLIGTGSKKLFGSEEQT